MLPALLLLAAVASAEPFGAPSAQPVVVRDPNASGAWFRKISSPDSTVYDGISASGVLPQPVFDPARMHVPTAAEQPFAAGPLDSPGVYVGAHAPRREADCGLKWDHRYDSKGQDTGLFAWRLFWRVTSPAGSLWNNPAPGSAQNIYLSPGDRFAMSLTVNPDGTATMTVRGDGDSAPSAAVTFPLDGFWDGSARLPRRFKRVHSIDQFVLSEDGRRVGDEGRPAVPTRARVDGGRWEQVFLTAPKPVKSAPMTGALAVEWRGPDGDSDYRNIFPSSAPDAQGGEDIVILPPHP
jgi:hypothetical protein